MKTKLLTICLLLVTSQVFAENRFSWEFITKSTDGSQKFYIDKNSIRKNNSGHYIVWTLTNIFQGVDAGKSNVMSQEYDCALLRYRWVYFENYNNHYGKGKKNVSFDIEEIKASGYYNWRYPKPNKNNYRLINWVCKK